MNIEAYKKALELFEKKLKEMEDRDIADAPFSYDYDEARIWYSGRESLLVWVLEQLPKAD